MPTLRFQGVERLRAALARRGEGTAARRVLVTKLSPDECYERLRALMASWGTADTARTLNYWLPVRPLTRVVAGTVSPRGFKLRRHRRQGNRRTWLEPTAMGEFVGMPGGTQIPVRISTYGSVKGGVALAAAFFGLILLLTGIVGGVGDAIRLGCFIVPAVWIFLSIVVALLRDSSEVDTAFLVQFLRDSLEAEEPARTSNSG